MRREFKPWQILLGSMILGIIVITGLGLWSQRQYLAYSPKEGDLIFQSLPHNPLVDAIEGATQSTYSHCGIVVRTADGWVVLEALGKVRKTPLFKWVRRGRNSWFAVYRITDLTAEKAVSFISAAESHLGKPYDTRYDLDDDAIYCSELIWKAYQQATGKKLGQLVTLGDLNWEPFESHIRKVEGGDPPLDRRMITPVALTRDSAVVRMLP